ncbi:MAG: hypothetical protein IJY55_00695 [Clostridia bacterium]|nr:hypothetical protein [Clostridia bacterium]
MGSALRQPYNAYTSIGGVMPMGNKVNVVLSDKEKENLNHSLKSSVYKELYRKSLITDRELRLLLEKAPKFLN